jgi:predicted Zn-dependent protease
MTGRFMMAGAVLALLVLAPGRASARTTRKIPRRSEIATSVKVSTSIRSRRRSELASSWRRMSNGQAKLVDDPVIAEYVNRIGQTLVRNSDAKVPFAN